MTVCQICCQINCVCPTGSDIRQLLYFLETSFFSAICGARPYSFFVRPEHMCLGFLCFQQLMTKEVYSVRFVQLIKGSLLAMWIAIIDYKITQSDGFCFSFLQLTFACASIGSFQAIFGSMLFLFACLVFMLKFFQLEKSLQMGVDRITRSSSLQKLFSL